MDSRFASIAPVAGAPNLGYLEVAALFDMTMEIRIYSIPIFLIAYCPVPYSRK